MRIDNIRNKKGIGLVEILIVIAVIAIGFLAIISFLIFSRGITFQVARNTRATTLAEEGIEAVRALRDEGWSNVSTAGTYYPVVEADKWVLKTIDPGPIDNLYTRTVVIEDVTRNPSTGDIDPSGAGSPDDNTKKLTVTVSWPERGGTKQVVLTTYIGNFLGN